MLTKHIIVDATVIALGYLQWRGQQSWCNYSQVDLMQFTAKKTQITWQISPQEIYVWQEETEVWYGKCGSGVLV